MNLNLLLSHPLLLCVAVYGASSLLMALLVPHQVASWSRSYKKRKLPSVLLRWHPAGPDSVALHGYALSPPDNDDKSQLWWYAFLPVANTSLLVWYAVVIPCVMLYNVCLFLCSVGTDGYQRHHLPH